MNCPSSRFDDIPNATIEYYDCVHEHTFSRTEFIYSAVENTIFAKMTKLNSISK